MIIVITIYATDIILCTNTAINNSLQVVGNISTHLWSVQVCECASDGGSKKKKMCGKRGERETGGSRTLYIHDIS